MTDPDANSPVDIADDLLVDGLLRSRDLDSRLDRERRIEGLMRRLDEETRDASRVSGAWSGWRLASAATIGVAVVLGLILVSRQSPPAYAELLRTLEAMETRADLSFELEVVGSEPPASPGATREPDRRRIRESVLHIRGPRYVITRALPNGPILAGGFDGSTYWSNVEGATDRPASLRVPARRAEELVSRLSVDLSKELRRLRKDYRIGPPTTEVDSNGEPVLHFTGTRREVDRTSARESGRSGYARAAARIDLWLDPVDRKIVQLELSGMRLRPDAPPVDLRLTAIDPPPLADDFFEASGHPVVDREELRSGREGKGQAPDHQRRRRRPKPDAAGTPPTTG